MRHVYPQNNEHCLTFSAHFNNFYVSFFMLVLCALTGEQEFTARNAGLSTIIVFSTMIPLLLLIIIISYRYIKRKNVEAEVLEKEIYFAELEAERQRIVDKMNHENQQKEIEIVKYLDEPAQSSSNQIQSNAIDGDFKVEQIDPGDSTDDEFFERPLPPVPSPPSLKSGQLSIIDNETISSQTSRIIQETPKVENTSSIFNFPEAPTRPLLPPFPPRPPSLSPPRTPTTQATDNDQRYSTQPTIIDLTPKPLLQSDF